MNIFNKLAKPILSTNRVVVIHPNNDSDNEKSEITDKSEITKLIEKTEKLGKTELIEKSEITEKLQKADVEELIENITNKIKTNEKTRQQTYNSEMFWDDIAKLNWTDVSDGIINVKSKRINISNFDKFKHELDNNIKVLRDKYVSENHHIIYDLTKKEINAFLSHIVAKGPIFYNAVLDDIAFADYLIETHEYQDLYSIF